jgi:hypothetical protein
MLRTSMGVGTQPDAVAFELTVSNDGDEAATLSFRTGQRTRFTVRPTDGGDAVWVSDADQMFMQMLGEESVPAGTSISFGETWESPQAGDYHVEGEVTCEDEELTAEAEFSV